MTTVVSHPVLDVMPLSGSVTVHATVTSPVYQPLAPSGPVTTGVTVGRLRSITV